MADTKSTLLETRRFNVVEHRVERPGGRELTCQVVEHPGSVAILPLVSDNQVCLIRSRRLTVGQTLVEVPAGTREPGEEPIRTAARELKEETGYTAGSLEQLTAYYPSPGVLSERMYVFVARDLTAGEPEREENEEIENLVISWDEALAMLDRGDIEDGKTIIALLSYERVRSK